jgi:hypothetical protein
MGEVDTPVDAVYSDRALELGRQLAARRSAFVQSPWLIAGDD